MFLPGWSAWCFLLTLCMSACAVEISEHDIDEVICSQGLSECTMEDAMILNGAENNVDVQTLNPVFKLCCEDTTTCALCLEIEADLYIHPDKEVEDEDHSGSGEGLKDYSDETDVPKASVTVCYNTAATMPTCKKVECTVNHTALTHHKQAKISMVITKPDGFPFSSTVFVYPSESSRSWTQVTAPSLSQVCSQKLKKRVPECKVPTVISEIKLERNQVELQFEGRNNTVPSMCVQYEQNGNCQAWNRMTIPLYSVTPCLCLQVWDEDDQISTRSLHCPFNRTDVLHVLKENIWNNVSVSVQHGKMNNFGTMLSWNLSAPCRLEGEVWLCHNENNCGGKNTPRQQLTNGIWRPNSKGHWQKTGVFENIDPRHFPCVKVKVKGDGRELGPFCVEKTGRWRWSLLIVGFMLLICLTGLIIYFLHDFVKKWVWSYRHGGFVKIGRRGHVVLLSPPDVDDGVSASVCQLGSFLCSQGFSVSVDQWSRKEQCTLGPLPWLHSQLLKLNSKGGRVLLVLTRKALERTEEWTQNNKDVIKLKGENKDLSHSRSPYSDVFTASLFLIQTDKQLGRAGERFLLVNFDSTQPRSRDRSLPELLQGLPLFQLPSQTQSLLAELTVVEAERRPDGRTWTRWITSTV